MQSNICMQFKSPSKGCDIYVSQYYLLYHLAFWLAEGPSDSSGVRKLKPLASMQHALHALLCKLEPALGPCSVFYSCTSYEGSVNRMFMRHVALLLQALIMVVLLSFVH